MPNLSISQYGKILYEVTKDLSKEDLEIAVQSFISFLKKQQKLSKYPQIAEAFSAYTRKQAGEVVLTLTTAREISKATIEQIQKQFGDQVKTVHAQDSRLIGGFVARVENTVIDASLKTQLETLRQTLS